MKGKSTACQKEIRRDRRKKLEGLQSKVADDVVEAAMVGVEEDTRGKSVSSSEPCNNDIRCIK